MDKRFIEGEDYTREEEAINVTIISQACDTAEVLTELECKVAGIECYVSEMEGETECLSYTEEAQDIFNVHYDEQTTQLYKLLNSQLKIIE